MDNAASKPTLKEQTTATKGLAAKYGAKWLQPTKKVFGKKSNPPSELSQSLPLEDSKKDEHQRKKISSVYTKRSWPPKAVLKSYKSVDESSPSNTDEKPSADTDDNHASAQGNHKLDGKSSRNSKLYDRFSGLSPFWTSGSVRNMKTASPHPRTKHSLHDSPATRSWRSSGHASFNTPQPYVKTKPFKKFVGADMEPGSEMQESGCDFFDSKNNPSPKSPSYKVIDKTSGYGFYSGAASQSDMELGPMPGKPSVSEESCSALKCLSLDDDIPRQSFAHYDWQSITFSFADVLTETETLKRKNEVTGASKAAAMSNRINSTSSEKTPVGSYEDLCTLGITEDSTANDMLEWCPFFVNEIGGEMDNESLLTGVAGRSTTSQTFELSHPENSPHSIASRSTTAEMLLVNNKGVSVVEKIGIHDDQQLNAVGFIQEYLDNGALYYRKHFFEQDHQNFFGIDNKYGPVAISVKREKLREGNASVKENIWNYRVIVRTSELCTLRGSVLEDVLLSQSSITTKALKAKDVLEYICPEIDFDCLKSAQFNEAVPKQLMKVDEQNIASSYKIGIMYCTKDQTTEEQMYSNESGSPGFEEFLDLLGDKIQLKGFDRFRGGLDVKTNSTGKESYFTTFEGTEIMFHVSTLLPFTANNSQQVLRKCHIGNDIVTIVFQEPDSPPFSAHNIHSRFQHLFFVVRVHQPCSTETCYRVSVTRAQDIPSFGPPIPKDALFPKSETFREFLLTKLLNGERAARSTGKFKAMSMNTRQEYLRDLATSYSSLVGLDASPRFSRFSFTAASRRVIDRDKPKNRLLPEEWSLGALVWHNITAKGIACTLGISDCMFLLICRLTNRVVFSIPCQAIIGWTEHANDVLHIYYGRGERLELRAQSCTSCDWRKEVKTRLQNFSIGCETKTVMLQRNIRGQLGFDINNEGIVMDIEANGHATDVGLEQGSRLVEICKILIVTMTHVEMLDLLRTSNVVTAIVVLPLEDGTPRRCSKSLYHISPILKMVEIGNTEAEKSSIYNGKEDGLLLHSRSDVVPGTKRRESVEDITHTLSQSIISKVSAYGSRNRNQNCSVLNSAALTPTASFILLPSERKMRQSLPLDPGIPSGFRAKIENRDSDKGRELLKTSHFTAILSGKSKENSLVAGGDTKHSASIEGGPAMNSYDYYRSSLHTRPIRPVVFPNKPTTATNIYPNQFSSKPTANDVTKPILRPKPFRPPRREPIASSMSLHHYTMREGFSQRAQVFRSTPAENGLHYHSNACEIGRIGTVATRREMHCYQHRNGLRSQEPKSNDSNMTDHPNYFTSPQVERRSNMNLYTNLPRAMSDESIYSNAQNQRNTNGNDGELQDSDFADTTLTNFAKSWDRSTFRLINSVQDPRATSASPGREDVCHSCASGYCSHDENERDDATPRSAESISPILLSDPPSSEDAGYERSSGFSAETNADARLRKIEHALRSLQSQLAKEQRSKRHILKEVEKLRKDNQRLQKQEEMRRQRRDMTYA